MEKLRFNISFGLYTVFFIVPIFFPDLFWIVGIICAFIILLYVVVKQQFHMMMERRYAGMRVLAGWIDEAGDALEEYEVQIKRIMAFSRLPAEIQKLADNTAEKIIKEFNERKEAEKFRTGVSIFELPLKEDEEEYYNED